MSIPTVERTTFRRADLEAVARRAGARSDEIEQARQLPHDLVDDLIDTGVFRMWVPQVYGGIETDVAAVLDAIETVAYHDGSTGWCVMIGATSGLVSGFLDPRWGAHIFGDPRAVTGGFAMPSGAAVPQDGGGLRVTGRWPWGSGTSHCTWIGGGVLVVDGNGAPAPRADGLRTPYVFFDRDDVEILDTWHVSGMKGTGSNDYAVTDAFVPEGRWGEFLRAEAAVEGPLYRFSFTGALALGVASVGLGLARRALDELAEVAVAKTPFGSSKVLAERQTVQLDAAEADAAIRSSRAFLADVVGECWAAANAGDPFTDAQRRLLRLAATNAMRRSAEAVDRCYEAAGGSAIWSSSPLQRCFRDVHVATQHGMVAPRTLEPLGRMQLGLPTDVRQL